jgi:hypothetical protein
VADGHLDRAAGDLPLAIAAGIWRGAARRLVDDGHAVLAELTGACHSDTFRQLDQCAPGMVAVIRGSTICATLGSAVRNSSKRLSSRGR